MAILVRTAQHRKDYTGGVNEYWLERIMAERGYAIRIGGKN
jgi:uncharacterized protein YmfQ (DUF2313 family)